MQKQNDGLVLKNAFLVTIVKLVCIYLFAITALDFLLITC